MNAQPSILPAPVSSNALTIPPEALPDVTHLVTEDDTPVDNIFSEKQQRLLTDALYGGWKPGIPFIALANVGVFFAIKQPPLVPDMLLSLKVTMPAEVWSKSNRSYFLWEYGKPPDVVIEVVSNREGGEADEKLERYAQIGVNYYVIFDPERHLSDAPLRLFKRYDTGYVETLERYLPNVGLGLTLWEGRFEDLTSTWLRWCDAERRLIPTGAELAETERLRAEEAQRQADNERQRAEEAQRQTDSERQRAEELQRQLERLAARLRESGLEP